MYFDNSVYRFDYKGETLYGYFTHISGSYFHPCKSLGNTGAFSELNIRFDENNFNNIYEVAAALIKVFYTSLDDNIEVTVYTNTLCKDLITNFVFNKDLNDMSSFFDDISGLNGVNGFVVDSFGSAYSNKAYNDEYGITLVKHNDFFYAEIEEEEGSYLEDSNRIYQLTDKWYMRFDYVKFQNALHNNEINPDDFDIYEYEL